jgi:hypothetical protein
MLTGIKNPGRAMADALKTTSVAFLLPEALLTFKQVLYCLFLRR